VRKERDGDDAGAIAADATTLVSMLHACRRRTEYVGIGDDYGEGLTCSSLFSIGGSCLTCCMSLGSLAWWLTDWILILKGSFPTMIAHTHNHLIN
jgi:hypothetical protein